MLCPLMEKRADPWTGHLCRERSGSGSRSKNAGVTVSGAAHSAAGVRKGSEAYGLQIDQAGTAPRPARSEPLSAVTSVNP